MTTLTMERKIISNEGSKNRRYLYDDNKRKVNISQIWKQNTNKYPFNRDKLIQSNFKSKHYYICCK